MEKIAITCPKCGTIFDLSEAVQEEFIRALTKEAQEREREDISLEMHDLRQQLKENKKLIKEAREKELELLRQKRLFDEKLENLELEIERKIDQEREGIAKEVKLKLEDDYKFRLEEKDHKLKQVIAELEAAQRKAEQSSQQLTGEIAEVNLEEMLAKAFPTDGFEPVKKGVSGADILHLVQTLDGESCGTIIWESKNTIHWNNQWLSKLKVDQLAAKAELAVLVSKTWNWKLSAKSIKNVRE
ncbi:MAG: DUF2130 domain-containing protein, partial [Anaerolineales bacterium]|nr:DUF2130 domain-containing protein [Anaerolineales bacterium]